MEELVGELFVIRNQAHLLHLLKSNYKEHIILEEFYTDFLKLTDKFIETSIGYNKTNLYINIRQHDSHIDNIEEFADTTVSTLEALRASVHQDFLKNIVDEMIEITAGLLYKTKFL